MTNMSEIQKILNKLGPLSSQQMVERFIKMLSERDVHTLSEKEFDRILMFATNDCYDFLKERLTMYLQNGIAHRNHKEIFMQSEKKSLSSLGTNTKQAMNKKETILDIARSIDGRARDERTNYYSNRAIARCLVNMHSSIANAKEGVNVCFLTNYQDISGTTRRDFTGSGAYYQTGLKKTSSIGQSVYKNTRLGGILSKYYQGTHSFPHITRNPRRETEITVQVLNRAIYDNFGSEVKDLEIRMSGDERVYRYAKLRDLLQATQRDQQRLDEEREKMRLLQEEKRKREEQERIAREKAEEAERLRLEEDRRQREEEEKKRQEEIERLEHSIEETNKNIQAIKNFLRTSVELRSQHILDEFQEDAKRSHLFDGIAVVIDGGPGTGKTTTTIQRLKFLLSKSALEEYDNPLTNEQIDFLTDRNEWNNRWLFFSPTELLLEYLRHNMAQEELIATEQNTRTLARFRQVKMRDYDLFNPSREGPFKPYKQANDKVLIKNPKKAILSFEQFCIDFIRSAMEKRVALKTDMYSWHDIAVSIKSTFANSKVKDIDGLMRMLNALSDRDKSNIKKIDGELRKLINQEALKVMQLIMLHEEKVSKINDLFEQWKRERFQETIDDEDDVTTDEEEEENAELEAFNRQDFETQLYSTLKKLLRKLGLRQIDSKTKLSKRDEDFLNIIDSLYVSENIDLNKIGELAWFTKNFASMCRGLESNLIAQIPKIYKAYRKQLIAAKANFYNVSLLEQIVKKDSNKHLHPEEQDLLLGFMNNMFFSIYHKSKNRFTGLKHKYVVAYKESVRPVIGIDEATDYSLLDYYLMVSFRHYDFSSITLSGDIMQGLNDRGIDRWDDLKDFILPNLEVMPLNISYRQLPTLLDISKEMYKDDQGEYPSYVSKIEKTEDEPRPLLLISDDEEEKAIWISKRIVEIYRNYGSLPSVAIFVGDDVNIDKFIQRIEDLELLEGIEIKNCSGNKLDSKEVVRVFRLSEVKGMEFEAVFFYDIDTAIENHSEKIMRRYLYVGVSRATSHLAATMTTSEGNETIIKYFDQETEGWI